MNKDATILGQGKSDPYARVEIVADRETHLFKTAVVPDNLHPVWKTVFEAAVDDKSTIEEMQIEVWDNDRMGKDDFLGRCCIPVQVWYAGISVVPIYAYAIEMIRSKISENYQLYLSVTYK